MVEVRSMQLFSWYDPFTVRAPRWNMWAFMTTSPDRHFYTAMVASTLSPINHLINSV